MIRPCDPPVPPAPSQTLLYPLSSTGFHFTHKHEDGASLYPLSSKGFLITKNHQDGASMKPM